jgi:hypothetical protein
MAIRTKCSKCGDDAYRRYDGSPDSTGLWPVLIVCDRCGTYQDANGCEPCSTDDQAEPSAKLPAYN